MRNFLYLIILFKANFSMSQDLVLDTIQKEQGRKFKIKVEKTNFDYKIYLENLSNKNIYILDSSYSNFENNIGDERIIYIGENINWLDDIKYYKLRFIKPRDVFFYKFNSHSKIIKIVLSLNLSKNVFLKNGDFFILNQDYYTYKKEFVYKIRLR